MTVEQVSLEPTARPEVAERSLDAVRELVSLSVTAPLWSLEPAVTEPGGLDEQRADSVADELMAAPLPEPASDATPPPNTLPPPIPPVGEAPPGGGKPLPPAVRRWAEAVAGVDLSAVRLHEGPDADRRAGQLGARAFTVGQDIVLSQQVQPVSTPSGRRTLAHELGHVIAPPAGGLIGRDGDDTESSKTSAGEQIVSMEAVGASGDIYAVMSQTKTFMQEIADIHWTDKARSNWDQADQDAGVPEMALYPAIAMVVTENYIVTLDEDADPLLLTPRDPKQVPMAPAIVKLLEATGVSAQLMRRSVQGVDGSDLALVVLKPKLPRLPAKPGESVLHLWVPGLTLKPETVADLNKRIAAKAKASKDGGGAGSEPQGWAKDEVAKLKKAKAMKAAKAGDPDGKAPTGQGKGDSGEGKGAGHAKGDGIGDGEKSGDPAEASKGVSGSGPLQGPVKYDNWVNSSGEQILAIGQDRAWTGIKLKDGESTEDLEKRADAALQKLQESRDTANSTRMAKGVNTTSFVQKKGETGAAGTQAEAETQANSATGAATPGERVPGAKGGANAPAYPSTMTMAGNPEGQPATTVSGATNDFTMTLDYKAMSLGFQDEVFNRLQDIQFYWEVIDVSGLTREKALEVAKNTKVGEGERETGLGAMGTNIKRTAKDVAEDQQADLDMMDQENWSWDARAEYLTVIGISNVVRLLGSIIGSFFDLLSEPLNGRSIGFDKDGDYLVRCVATPQATDEQKADPAHHVLRASSVAVMPVRVRAINLRAQEAVGREERELAAKQAAYDKELAKKDPASTQESSKLKALRQDLETAKTTSAKGAFDTLQGQIDQLQKAIDIAKRVQDKETHGVSRDQWDEDELQMKLTILMSKATVSDFIRQREEARDALKGKDGGNVEFAKKHAAEFVEVNGKKDFRPRMALASEETGQVSDILCMLGQISAQGAIPVQWRLVDITSDATHDYYTGSSPLPGTAGRAAAIRDAFRNFAENADYGRGTLAIRLPAELVHAPDGDVQLDATMASRPGPKGRFLQRLKDLGKVAAVAGIVATGGAGVAVGAIGGVAGGIVAVDSLVKRARTGQLMEWGTVLDALGVIAGVASMASVGTYYARAAAETAAKAAGSMPEWVSGLEKTEKVLHIHAQFGMVQQLVTIPIELAVEWDATEKLPDDDPQKGRRRMRALLSAVESGLMTMAQLTGGFGHAEESAQQTPEEPLPKGTGKEDAQSRVEGSGPQKPPARETPSEGQPPKDQKPPPAKKSVEEMKQEARDAARATLSRMPAATEEIEPDEAQTKGQRNTARGTPGHDEAHSERGTIENAGERQKALDSLERLVGKERQIEPTKGGPPLKQGDVGGPTKSADKAIDTYHQAVAAAGGREVGLFFNANTGEFQVRMGTEHEVYGPVGDGWQTLVHLHPNPGNVSTFRLPAPADISGTIRAAARTGSHTEYVQSHMPDGSSGMTKVTVTLGPPANIRVEMPEGGGLPRRVIDVPSVEAYAKEYGDETTYIDPSSPEYAWVMRDLDNYYANRDDGSNTARGTAKRGKAGAEPEDELFADAPVVLEHPLPEGATPKDLKQRIKNLKDRIKRLRELTSNKGMRKKYDEDLRDLEKLSERSTAEDVTGMLDEMTEHVVAERRALTPVPIAKVRALAERARSRASKATGEQQAKLQKIADEAESLANRMDKDPENGGRAAYDLFAREIKTIGREDYEVVVPLLDPAVRDQVIAEIERGSEELQGTEIGKTLMERILGHLKTADMLTLRQSPRQSGDKVAGTDKMRRDVKRAIRAAVDSKMFPDEYCSEFLEAARGHTSAEDPEGWPHDPAGVPWEVDHIAELWLGGADDISNYLAIPKTVHDAKTALFKKFRDDYRSGKVLDDQVDIREAGAR